MSYPVAAGAILEMQYRYTYGGQQCINVFHFKWGGAVDITAEIQTELLTSFDLTYCDGIRLQQVTQVQNRRVRGQFIYPTRYISFEKACNAATGVLLEDGESVGTCVVCRRKSTFANRRGRGRSYFAGVAESDVNIGTLTGAAQTAWTTNVLPVLDEGIDSITAGEGADPVIWSPAFPLQSYLVEVTELDPNVRYQRRREVGRGI